MEINFFESVSKNFTLKNNLSEKLNNKLEFEILLNNLKSRYISKKFFENVFDAIRLKKFFTNYNNSEDRKIKLVS